MSPSDADVVDQVVTTARFPLLDPTGAGWREVVPRVRHELRTVGCSVLPDFVGPPCATRCSRSERGSPMARVPRMASASSRLIGRRPGAGVRRGRGRTSRSTLRRAYEDGSRGAGAVPHTQGVGQVTPPSAAQVSPSSDDARG